MVTHQNILQNLTADKNVFFQISA